MAAMKVHMMAITKAIKMVQYSIMIPVGGPVCDSFVCPLASADIELPFVYLSASSSLQYADSITSISLCNLADSRQAISTSQDTGLLPSPFIQSRNISSTLAVTAA